MSPAEWIRRGAAALTLLRGGAAEEPASPAGEDDCRRGRRAPGRGCDHRGCDSVPLTELATGETATVTCLEDTASPGARQLAALGILPGTRVRPLQRSPAWVLRVGYSELALDRELAALVRVRRD